MGQIALLAVVLLSAVTQVSPAQYGNRGDTNNPYPNNPIQGQFGNRGDAGNLVTNNPAPSNPWAEYNPFSCQGREPGYYADHSRGCQRYYRCVQNYPQPFQFECGEGTRFDERINNCNWPENVDCY